MIPLPYRIAAIAALIVAVWAFGYHRGSLHVQGQWNASKAAETASINEAILERVAENAKQAEAQSAINAAITKAKNEDLAPVVAAISADRLRIGPALCPGRSAAPAQAESASISHAADNESRGIPPELERDIRALEIRVEEALATGRACQNWITENGMAP